MIFMLNANVTYRQHKNKKWEYRIRFKDPITGKRRERSKRGFATKSEAKYAAEKIQQHLQNGYDQSNILLKDYLDFWLKEYKENNVRRSTYSSLENSIENHVKPYFKNIELRTLTPALYQEFLNHLHLKGLARGTVLKTHNTFYGAMKRAKINKNIIDNPCENAIIQGKKTDDNLKFIESSEVSNFLTHAYKYGYIYWIFFKLLIETGMRKGEAGALQWNDINFKNRTIDIKNSLEFQAKSSEELFGETKNFSSQRTITMSKSLADDLKFHLSWQNQNKTKINDLYHHDLNLVLCRENGNFMPKSTLFNAFVRILKRAGINQLPIHSLRHTHAVILLEAGADMKYIQERLGHGSYQITADVYSHVSTKMEDKNTDKYEAYFKNITE